MKVLKNNNRLSFFSLVLLALFPLLPFNISSLTFTLVIIVFLFTSNINSTRENVIIFFSFILFFLVMLVSVFYSENIERGISKLSRLLPLFLAPLALFFSNNRSLKKKQKNFIFHVFITVNIVFVFSAICVYVFGIEDFTNKYNFHFLVNNSGEVMYRITTFKGGDFFIFTHKAYFSMSFLMCILYSLNQAIVNSDAFNLKNIFVIIFFSIILIYVCSVPNIFCLITLVIFAVIFHKPKINRKWILLSSFLILLSVLVSYNYNERKRERYLTHSDGNINKELRFEIYETLIPIIKSASWSETLFGYGIGDVNDKLNTAYKLRLKNFSTKNKLYFSNNFKNNYWFKNNVIAISDNILKTKKLKSNLHSYNISTKIETVLDKEYTLSVFAKATDKSNLILALGGAENKATFSLSDLRVIEKSKHIIKTNIKSTNSGYIRCSITGKFLNTNTVLLGVANLNGDYKYSSDNIQELNIKNVQLEEGAMTTNYVPNETYDIAKLLKQNLNTHNNFLHFFLAAGLLGLISFIVFLINFLTIAISNKDFIQISFIIIVTVNAISENIFARHYGLMFFAFFAILLFDYLQYTQNDK